MREAREFTKGKRFSFGDIVALNTQVLTLILKPENGEAGKEYSKANRLLTAGLVFGQLQASGT